MPWITYHGNFVWKLSLDVTLHLSLGKFRLVTMAWYAWLVIIVFFVNGSGSLALDLWIGIFGLGQLGRAFVFGCLGVGLRLGFIGFGHVALDRWLGTIGLG